jgi:Zn-dependent M28 family amino/carboxypeptidase
LNVDPKIEETVTKNVIAIAEGSDPVLKNEYVAFGAHYDHVGMRTTGEDRIFNGADDDGSGTVALIEMAHAAMKDRNHKRSFLFVWHTGEEKGLWGSEYFVNNPTVPLNNIITQLNADMIGRSATPGRSYREPMTDSNSIHILGHGRLSSDLERIVYDVNRNFLNLRYETHYDRPNDPQNLYQRSDHYNYAVKGIPICFWFDGIHEDYHQVSDEVDKIDFPKLEKVSRTIFATAWTLANAPNRPRVDRNGRPR